MRVISRYFIKDLRYMQQIIHKTFTEFASRLSFAKSRVEKFPDGKLSSNSWVHDRRARCLHPDLGHHRPRRRRQDPARHGVLLPPRERLQGHRLSPPLSARASKRWRRRSSWWARRRQQGWGRPRSWWTRAPRSWRRRKIKYDFQLFSRAIFNFAARIIGRLI